jgi:hypothetical protein
VTGTGKRRAWNAHQCVRRRAACSQAQLQAQQLQKLTRRLPQPLACVRTAGVPFAAARNVGDRNALSAADAAPLHVDVLAAGVSKLAQPYDVGVKCRLRGRPGLQGV